jgi:arylsulfatase A-like enzyme
MLLGLVPLLLACGGAERSPSAPRLVVLYAPCTVNRSFLSPYDPNADITPHLEAFARDGVVFERHWSEAGQSGAAFASIFAGAQVPVHGVFAHPSRVDDSVQLVGEAFAEAGYEVFFWGGHPMASGRLNYGQGAEPDGVYGGRLRADDPRFGRILERLRVDRQYRAFIATTFSVTHAPYSADHLDEFCRARPEHCAAYRRDPKAVRRYAKLHSEQNGQLANNFPATVRKLGLNEAQVQEMVEALELLYKSNIHLLDATFGALLTRIDELGSTGESLIAFTADHGEALYRERALFKWNHGWELSPDVLRIPWIVRGVEGMELPSRYRGVTRSIDVFPTLAGLAGLQRSSELEGSVWGIDLSPALTGRAPAPELNAYSHTVLMHPKAVKRSQAFDLWVRFHGGIPDGDMWVSLRDEAAYYKYRNLDGETWGFQAFDLDRDPHAEQNLYDPENPEHRLAAQQLIAYQSALVGALRASRGLPALERRDIESLRALGYVE